MKKIGSFFKCFCLRDNLVLHVLNLSGQLKARGVLPGDRRVWTPWRTRRGRRRTWPPAWARRSARWSLSPRRAAASGRARTAPPTCPSPCSRSWPRRPSASPSRCSQRSRCAPEERPTWPCPITTYSVSQRPPVANNCDFYKLMIIFLHKSLLFFSEFRSPYPCASLVIVYSVMNSSTCPFDYLFILTIQFCRLLIIISSVVQPIHTRLYYGVHIISLNINILFFLIFIEVRLPVVNCPECVCVALGERKIIWYSLMQ